MNPFKIGDHQISIPIIQGGMGIGISLSRLASSVANMGGVGVIATVGIGFIEDSTDKNYKSRNIKAVRKEIRRARALSNGVLGVNIMSVITNYADMVQTSIEEGIDLIFSGAGLPLDLPKYLPQGTKTKLVPIVSSARAASIITQKWLHQYDYLPDAFVLEGPKAGGHLGFKPKVIHDENYTLEKLLPDLLNFCQTVEEKHHIHIPVIAAGGIYSGGDMFRIMKQGASAVQLGTRFVATQECDASLEFKQAFIDAQEKDVKIIISPVGMPGRAIYNHFLMEVDSGIRKPLKCTYHCIKSCDPNTTSYCIFDALLSAYQGNLANGFAFTGSNVGRVKEISTVPEVFHQLISEYEEAESETIK